MVVGMKKKKLKYTAGRGIFRSILHNYIDKYIGKHGYISKLEYILVYPIGNNDLDILSHIWYMKV